jgi:hypothetical protein
MPAHEYYFVSNWRVPCTPTEAYDIIKDSAALPEWWPSAFLHSEPHYFPDGVEGVSLATKGWMPYILHWTVRELSSDPPGSLVIEVSGDFEGRGIWTLMQDGDYTNITYDWRIRVEKPGVKQLSFLLKPLFESNHRWAMKKGEQSMRLELMRRRATSEAVRNAIEPPPGPTSVPIVPIAGALALLVLWKLRPRKKKTRREQAVALAGAAAAVIGKQTRQARKEGRRTARRADRELRRRSGAARERLEAAIDRAQEQGGSVRSRATSFWERTDLDERAGAARDRLEAAIERANIPERVEAARERVAKAIDDSDLPERIEAARERVEQAIDRSDVPERIEAARKTARKRAKGVFGRWHL